MENTQAIVIIADSDKEAAVSDLGGGFFSAPLSSDGNAPTSHWMSSGYFLNSELNSIVNVFTWPKKVYFGNNWQAALDAEKLKQVVETPTE